MATILEDESDYNNSFFNIILKITFLLITLSFKEFLQYFLEFYLSFVFFPGYYSMNFLFFY